MLSLLDNVMRMETERKNRDENKCASKMERHIQYVVTVRDKYGQRGNNKEDWVGFQGE